MQRLWEMIRKWTTWFCLYLLLLRCAVLWFADHCSVWLTELWLTVSVSVWVQPCRRCWVSQDNQLQSVHSPSPLTWPMIPTLRQFKGGFRPSKTLWRLNWLFKLNQVFFFFYRSLSLCLSVGLTCYQLPEARLLPVKVSVVHLYCLFVLPLNKVRNVWQLVETVQSNSPVTRAFRSHFNPPNERNMRL